MHNLVIVDEGFQKAEYYRELFKSAKTVSGSETITVITAGAFLRNGFPSPTDKYERAQKMLNAGASYVVEMPSYALLLGDNQYAFAVMSMLHKLPDADGVLLPYRADSEELFEKVRRFLFAEPFPYQAQLKKRKLAGENPEKIFPEVAERFVPGAETCLAEEQNRFAIELANTLIRSYSTIKVVWLNLRNTEFESVRPVPEDRSYDRLLEAEFRNCIEAKPEMQRSSWMKDIFMGSDQLVEHLLAYPADTEKGIFAGAVYKGKEEKAVRRYIWGCLAGYRRIDNSISILYGFVPYIRLLEAEKPVEIFAADAKAEVLIDRKEGRDFSALADESKQILVDCDERIHAVWTKVKGRKEND